MISLTRYIESQIKNLKDYHDTEVNSLRTEARNLHDAINHTAEELQRQVTELHDQAGSFVRQPDFQRQHQILIDRIDTLDRQIANFIGRGVGLALVGGVFIAVVAAFLTHLFTS